MKRIGRRRQPVSPAVLRQRREVAKEADREAEYQRKFAGPALGLTDGIDNVTDDELVLPSPVKRFTRSLPAFQGRPILPTPEDVTPDPCADCLGTTRVCAGCGQPESNCPCLDSNLGGATSGFDPVVCESCGGSGQQT